MANDQLQKAEHDTHQKLYDMYSARLAVETAFIQNLKKKYGDGWGKQYSHITLPCEVEVEVANIEKKNDADKGNMLMANLKKKVHNEYVAAVGASPPSL